MAIEYKIHPAIGVARVGNSPDEFFIGPEIPGQFPHPPGGFKDPQCRVKRQAARFYIFKYDDAAPGTVTNVTTELADLVTWSVAPTCAKRGPEPIDTAAITGRLQRAEFALHTAVGGATEAVIPLGEIRTDEKGRLIVLGGFGQAGPIPGTVAASSPDPMLTGPSGLWWDDTCESPVFAQFTVDGTMHSIQAWVVVAPPKFRPHQAMVNSFYASRVAAAIAAGDVSAAPAVGPGLTAAGLDKAALENVSASTPGLEVRAGTATYHDFWLPTDPLRLDPLRTGGPHDSALFELGLPNPWHEDYSCGWGLWESLLSAAGIFNANDMWNRWHVTGFMVDQNGTLVESERCTAALSITLLTPHLDFGDVPEGPGTAGSALRAIEFEVVSTSDITLSYTLGAEPGAPFTAVAPAGGDPLMQTVLATGGLTTTVRFWVRYTTPGDPAGDLGEVTIEHASQSWTITLAAQTVARRVTATALVLDRSGSMSESSGPSGPDKHQSLIAAARTFIDLAYDGDFVQLVRYDDSAQAVPAVMVGDVSAAAPSELTSSTRTTFGDLIDSEFTPAGATSIGEGLNVAVARLALSSLDDEHKALLVLTDGQENSPSYVADVAASVSSRTYAIGLGTPQNTSAAVLQALSGNNGGYLLMTGAIGAGSSNQFLLQKFFVQVQAGIQRSEIVLDPDGELLPGRERAIPFSICDADAGLEVILLTEHAGAIDFTLIAPGGTRIEPWVSAVDPTVHFALSPRLAFYRLALPAEQRPGRLEQAGTWHALLRIGAPRLKQPADQTSPADVGLAMPADWSHRRAALLNQTYGAARPTGRSVPFSLVVRASSHVGLRATALQSGFEPGARVELDAGLLDSGVLPLPALRIWAETTNPDGTAFELVLKPAEPGNHRAVFTTRVPGVYRCRVRAQGKDALGYPFTRERTLTAAVWHGGDRAAAEPRHSGQEQAPDGDLLCSILSCLQSASAHAPAALDAQLRALGIDWARLRECLLRACRERQPGPREVERALEVARAQARAAGAAPSSKRFAGYRSPDRTMVATAPAAASPASPPGSRGKSPGECNC